MYCLKQHSDFFLKHALLVIAILFLLPACIPTEESGPSPEEIEEIVIAREKDILDQWAQGNTTYFTTYAADDLVYIDNTRPTVVGKEAFDALTAELEGKVPPHTWEMVDPRVQVYETVAILSFQWHAMFDTIPATPWIVTSVYHLNDTVWQMVHVNWSVVKEE